ncbi:hypothetical protein IJH01_01285 [Candidatus Saccharibacteria bacterium]|nr:hypothetical protein [Candidatus Saccharibacteria bacterium]
MQYKKSSHQNELPISQIINKYKSSYKKFKPIYSPALNQDIQFSMPGFKHLIFKGKHRRPNKVIYSRMVLIPLIKPVIRKCNEITEIRNTTETIKGKRLKVQYYALEARVGKSSTRVRVVVKKIGKNGEYYFQSVMKYN